MNTVCTTCKVDPCICGLTTWKTPRIKITARAAKGWDDDFFKHAGVLERYGLRGNRKAKHYTGIVDNDVAQAIITEAMSWPAWSVEVVRVDNAKA